LLPRDPRHLVEEGAQVIQESSGRQTFRSLGHVTSSYFSAALSRTIALGLISNGRARIGETLYIPMPDGDIAAEVTSPVFYDPKGERLHA
jgi:sarcosine oxidase subunit alpha